MSTPSRLLALLRCYPLLESGFISPCVHTRLSLLLVAHLDSMNRPATPMGAMIGGVVGGVLVVGAVILGILLKTGRLKGCKCCASSNPITATAAPGDSCSATTVVNNNPEVEAPSTLTPPPGTGPGDGLAPPDIKQPVAAGSAPSPP